MAEYMEGRELDWDESIPSVSEGFELIPEGNYDFVIERYERARSQGNDKLPPCNMAIVYFRVNDRGREVVIRENYILHDKFSWKLAQLFIGVGARVVEEKVQMNWSMLSGATGRARVSLDADRNDPSKKYNHIKKIYPKEIKQFEPGRF